MTAQSNFIINSFYTPNQYVDVFMSYLTSDEYKVLSYAVRRIFGFNKRQDHISISQFIYGVKKFNGGMHDRGTGLCIGTVKKCIASLCEFGIMVKVEKNNRKTNNGDLWTLVRDVDKVNLDALKARRELKSITNANRITKARIVRQAQKSA